MLSASEASQILRFAQNDKWGHDGACPANEKRTGVRTTNQFVVQALACCWREALRRVPPEQSPLSAIAQRYRFICSRSCIISSTVLTMRVFAWKPRCVIIRLVNSEPMSAFDISR